VKIRLPAAESLGIDPAVPGGDFSATTVVKLADPPADPSPDDSYCKAVDDIISPLDGEAIEPDDVDGLIDLYEQIDALDERLYTTKLQIREALAAQSEGDKKTRRVAGHRRRAKLTFPSDGWDNSILKEAWESYPQFRDEYLRINKIDPRVREVKKLIDTAGPPDLTSFRDMVSSAQREATSPPTVKIEK